MLENLSLVALFVSAVENSKLGNNFTCYASISIRENLLRYLGNSNKTINTTNDLDF